MLAVDGHSNSSTRARDRWYYRACQCFFLVYGAFGNQAAVTDALHAKNDQTRNDAAVREHTPALWDSVRARHSHILTPDVDWTPLLHESMAALMYAKLVEYAVKEVWVTVSRYPGTCLPKTNVCRLTAFVIGHIANMESHLTPVHL